MADEQPIDLASGIPVTGADVAALREARRQTPSWFAMSWQELQRVIPPAAPAKPTATDAWQPFRLA